MQVELKFDYPSFWSHPFEDYRSNVVEVLSYFREVFAGTVAVDVWMYPPGEQVRALAESHARQFIVDSLAAVIPQRSLSRLCVARMRPISKDHPGMILVTLQKK